MPFIDVKLSKKITDAEKDKLKSELGKCVAIMHKPESYLMVGVCDGYDLYFAGNKLNNGAFVSVSVFGKVAPSDAEKMSGAICTLLKNLFGTDGSDVYITYSGVSDWGWNGGNF